MVISPTRPGGISEISSHRPVTMVLPCFHRVFMCSLFVKQDSCSVVLHVLFRFFVLRGVEGSIITDLSSFLVFVSCFSTFYPCCSFFS